MRPTRVVHVLATAQERGTATARFVRALAHGLHPELYQLHAWFLGGDGPLADRLSAGGIPVRTFAWTGDRCDVAGAWSFWRALRREQYSIVHMNFGGRAVPLLARSASRAKVLLHLHDSGAEAGEVGPIVVRTSSADAVVAVSHAVAGAVRGAHPNVVHYGIQAPALTERRRSNTGGGLVMGTAGRLVPIKGIAYLITAFAALRRDLPQLRLEIAGAGPEEAALRAQVHALRLHDHVVFVGWQPEMWPLLERWDVFVQPSLDEGLGMAVIEAMAAGLPVVGTTVGGLPELIEEGRTGFLVPAADSIALERRLRDLLPNAALRDMMGAAARARVRERFSAARMAADIAAIYDEVLSAEVAYSRFHSRRAGLHGPPGAA